jgi:hypothetical protein
MQRARPRRVQSTIPAATPLPEPNTPHPQQLAVVTSLLGKPASTPNTPPGPQQLAVPASLSSNRKPASSPVRHNIPKADTSLPRPSTFNVNLLKRRLESLPNSPRRAKQGKPEGESDTISKNTVELVSLFSPLLNPC